MKLQDVCDVVTSPIDPLIIASCSDDTTVRIWSLDPKHEKQPCLCILGGEGHYWNLLTLVRKALFPLSGRDSEANSCV